MHPWVVQNASAPSRRQRIDLDIVLISCHKLVKSASG
jgi:hypothetical protein